MANQITSFLAALPRRVDVLIAGAGPAGLCAALALRRAFVEVAVVDSRPRIGEPVRCGEVASERYFELLDLEPRAAWIRRRLGDGSGFVVLDRQACEGDLAEIAAQRGAHVAAGVSVSRVSPFDGSGRQVWLKAGRESIAIHAGCVLAADGVSSAVARMTGLNTYLPLDRLASGVAYFMVDVRPPKQESIHVEPLPPPFPAYPYYFWIIPGRPGEANVGLYVPGRDGSRAQALLDRQIGAKKALSSGRRQGTIVGIIPDAPPLERPIDDGLCVVGGAARFIHPLSGGGIVPAAESGRAAATALIALGGKSATAKQLGLYVELVQPLRRSLLALWAERRRTEAQVARPGPWRSICERDWVKGAK